MTTPRPKVSIIVPNYNYERFLGPTLDSVLAQTCTDWELIVVDDNSSDGSRALVEGCIRRYPERRITLLHNAAGPSGTPTPINMGIRRMTGEFFAWLSSDDIFEPSKLEEQLAAFDREPGLGLVHTAYGSIDEAGRITGTFYPPDAFDTGAFTALLDGNFINGNTVLVRRTVLDECGPFIETDSEVPELWRAAEYYHWLKIASSHPVRCLQSLLHRGRRHAGNADYNGSAMGPALERILIRRFFNEHPVPPTPAIVLALFGRGLWIEGMNAFNSLDSMARQEALGALESLERDQERWDTGNYGSVRRLDGARVRSAFRAAATSQGRAMLEAVSCLPSAQLQPYSKAARRKLSCLE